MFVLVVLLCNSLGKMIENPMERAMLLFCVAHQNSELTQRILDNTCSMERKLVLIFRYSSVQGLLLSFLVAKRIEGYNY